MRGATYSSAALRYSLLGLSPLARGNLGLGQCLDFFGGPIPACAGQPRTAKRRSATRGAYPRLRGATIIYTIDEQDDPGLSPLARGNLQVDQRLRLPRGPIPACAGQPVIETGSSTPIAAYPRLRGATVFFFSSVSLLQGLSPLARGNRSPRARFTLSSGPIPACAGQPGSCARSPCRHRAYPRLRGATVTAT